jgi:transposase
MPELMSRGAVKRSGPGRPKLRPRTVVGDRGYTGKPSRDYLRRRGISAVIPQLKTEKTPRLMDRVLYRERNVVERLVGRLKEYRRIATTLREAGRELSRLRPARLHPDLALKTERNRPKQAPNSGSFKKGQTGNPAGRPKIDPELQQLAKEHDAVQTRYRGVNPGLVLTRTSNRM